MKRIALVAVAFACAIAGLHVTTQAQPTHAKASPTPSASPTPQPPALTAKPPSAFVGTSIAFAYAPLPPRTSAVTIAFGDGSTGTLDRPVAMMAASSVATGSHAYTSAGSYRACVPASTSSIGVASTRVCTVVNIIAILPVATPSALPSATPTASPAPNASPTFIASPAPTVIPTRTASPTPVPTTSPTEMPSPVVTAGPQASARPSPAPTRAATATPTPTYPITGWTLAWANGFYAVDVAPSNAIPPAIAQITVGSAKRVIGQWIVDGLPMATQSKTQTMPGDVLTFEYDFPLQPAASRDASVHRVAFVLLDPVSNAPAGAPTPAPSIAYRYDIGSAPTSPIDSGAAAGSAPNAALQFDGFLVAVAHLTVDPAGTVSGDGNAHLADLTFPVRFSGLTIGNAHATALGVTSDVTSGTATTPAGPAACLRTAPNSGSADAAFAGELGTFYRFSYAFSLMSATLAPRGAQSTATLCFAPPNVQRGEAASDGFNLGTSSDATFGDPAARALALGLPNVPIDEDGAFVFDLPGDRVASWRVGNSTFATTPDASLPYHFAFVNDSQFPHVSCDGVAATGRIFQALDASRVHAALSPCAWVPGGVDATIAIAPKTAITLAEPYRFELVIDSSALAVAGSSFTGGPISGAFFANRSAPPIASAPDDASTFNAGERAKSAAAFVPLDVGARASTSDPSGTFSGSFSKDGDLSAVAMPAPWSAASFEISPASASLFASGGQAAHATLDAAVGTSWAEAARQLMTIPGLFVSGGTIASANGPATPFDANATGSAFGLVFDDGTQTSVVTSDAVKIPRPSAIPAGPRPTVTVVPGTTTFEIRWPAMVGYRGYVLLRRDPAGNVVTLDPLVCAFAYRDALAAGAHGDFAYALRIVSVHGVGPAGPFVSAKGVP